VGNDFVLRDDVVVVVWGGGKGDGDKAEYGSAEYNNSMNSESGMYH
jgi:hypothetical protein